MSEYYLSEDADASEFIKAICCSPATVEQFLLKCYYEGFAQGVKRKTLKPFVVEREFVKYIKRILKEVFEIARKEGLTNE